ncbi:MAG: hypothetical protein JXP34_02795 [Planctomycetes bacterium]|nr:hypothetical protein [Planctomycetota bacterium]
MKAVARAQVYAGLLGLGALLGGVLVLIADGEVLPAIREYRTKSLIEGFLDKDEKPAGVEFAHIDSLLAACRVPYFYVGMRRGGNAIGVQKPAGVGMLPGAFSPVVCRYGRNWEGVFDHSLVGTDGLLYVAGLFGIVSDVPQADHKKCVFFADLFVFEKDGDGVSRTPLGNGMCLVLDGSSLATGHRPQWYVDVSVCQIMEWAGARVLSWRELEQRFPGIARGGLVTGRVRR